MRFWCSVTVARHEVEQRDPRHPWPIGMVAHWVSGQAASEQGVVLFVACAVDAETPNGARRAVERAWPVLTWRVEPTEKPDGWMPPRDRFPWPPK